MRNISWVIIPWGLLSLNDWYGSAHPGAKHSIKSNNSSISSNAWHSFYSWQPLCTPVSCVTFLIAGVSRKTMKSFPSGHTRHSLDTCGKGQDVRKWSVRGQVGRNVTDIRQWWQTSGPGETVISLRSMVSLDSFHVNNDIGRDVRLLPRRPSQTTITWQETIMVTRQTVKYVVDLMF